ncbi:MAG TPA: TIGR02302 family protein, partial [Candidatus Sulfotelmatobacter sp.]|nr:TIGR02302 family protein [Candidatus Sulfotelmatobacter sp.]
MNARSDPALALPRLARRLGLATGALLWERLWPALWPALAVAGLFLAVSLFDLWSLAPGPSHLAGLVLFALAFAAALAIGLRGFAWPSRGEARRRLERASGLMHRPLSQLEDRPAGERLDPATLALWQAHHGRLLAALGRLRVGLPRAGLAPRDPWALRGLLLLLIVSGLVVAGSDAERRVVTALTPGFVGGATVPTSIDAWISPPAYTGLPPIFLTREDGPIDTSAAPVKVPVGSTLAVRVHGGYGAPALALDGKSTPFETVDAQNHQISAVVKSGDRLTVSQNGSTLADWRIAILPDLPPEIAFAEPPSVSGRDAVKLHYKASDDYGLAKISVEIRRLGSEESVRMPLPLSALNPKSANDTGFLDLTAHPWAGLKVTLTLVAEDGIGQKGRSDAVEFTLPARDFQNPVARAIVELRRMLATHERPTAAISGALGAIAAAPETFRNDLVAFLALSAARARLDDDKTPAGIAGVEDLLWDTALRIEDGNLSLAERDLRQAQRALMDALARNAPDAEIQKLMDQMQQALDQFLKAMADNARQQNQDSMSELPPNAQMLTQEDLQRMMDRARELAQSGARDAARDMLAQLQNILENLRQGRAGRGQGRQSGEQAMRRMNDLLHRQQQLLDRTFRQSLGDRPQGQRGEAGEGQDAQGMANEQEQLRRELGQLMQGMGDQSGNIP